MKSYKNIFLPILLSAGLIGALIVLASGTIIPVVFVPAILISLVFYFALIAHRVLSPERILPLYLLALAVQLLHFMEEYLGGFQSKFPALFGMEPIPDRLFVAFVMIAYSLFLLGAIAIYKQVKWYMVVPILFILVGTIGNAIAHTAFAIMAEGYFPGLYTALVYWVLGPMLVIRITR